MKNVLVVCPTQRDYRELPGLGGQYNFLFAGSNPRESLGCFDPVAFVDKITALAGCENIEAVIGTHDYPSSIIASAIARKLDLPSLDILTNMLCQHKYYSRLYQKEVVPGAVPEFKLVDPFKAVRLPLEPPFFLKPVKSFFSIFARRIDSYGQYMDFLDSCKCHFSGFMKPFNKLIETYTPLNLDGNYLIAEKLLEGSQATLEGYIFNGKFEVIGVTDSIMYPNTISFKRFDYPSRVSDRIKQQMADISRKALNHIGFDNGIFNIEFIYNPRSKQLNIIEINPRMCSQFADLMEKVNGANTYQIQLDIALGKKPIKSNRGKYGFASSFALRTFRDKIVSRLPGPQEVEEVKELFPEARIEVYGQQGRRLSCFMQDIGSYLYAIINLGGRSRDELFEKFNICKHKLGFGFQDP
ncbi:MAG: ATP-grasp domain-containing protein [Actinomycetota bacterium]